MTVREVPSPLLAEQRIVELCPHCKSDGLKATDVGPDLRTVTVRCAQCGRVSIITVSE
jgi:transcription elongation factor Elf1